jgi:hypothetical protein
MDMFEVSCWCRLLFNSWQFGGKNKSALAPSEAFAWLPENDI